MTPTEYLEAELTRYFPDDFVTVTFNADETITAHVRDTPASDPHLTLVCYIGSDDDWYEFSEHNDANDCIVTVPLMTGA